MADAAAKSKQQLHDLLARRPTVSLLGLPGRARNQQLYSAGQPQLAVGMDRYGTPRLGVVAAAGYGNACQWLWFDGRPRLRRFSGCVSAGHSSSGCCGVLTENRDLGRYELGGRLQESSHVHNKADVWGMSMGFVSWSAIALHITCCVVLFACILKSRMAIKDGPS